MTGITARRAAQGAALLGLVGLSACTGSPLSAPADQAVPMAFGACLERIEQTASRIGQEPAVLADITDSRIVRFTDEGEIVTVTCDGVTDRMIVQTRPAPPAPL